MRSKSECRARFRHCDRSFISPVMYKSASIEIIVMSGSVFQASSHLRNASTETVHLPRLPL